MTRTIIAVLAATAFASPVFAQGRVLCTSEATQIQAAVERSSLPKDQKTQVNGTLGAAIEQEKSGNAQGCQATLDQVKLALGIQPQPAAGAKSGAGTTAPQTRTP
jgi:hypothetical protein